MIFLLQLVLTVGLSMAEPCTLCRGDAEFTFPGKEINVPGFPFIRNCGQLNGTISLLQDGSSECQLIQDVGTICGCPRQPNTCNLCPSGSTASNPKLEVPILFQDLFQGFVPTCELFEAYLHNVEATNSTCTLAQQVLSDYCGCSSNQEENVGQCQLCPNGNLISYPNKTLDLENFPINTCQELQNASMLFLREGSETCTLLQSVGTFCGCPPAVENGCSLCQDGSPATNQSRPMPFLEEEFGFVPTCGLFEAFLLDLPGGAAECSTSQLFGSYCGCPPLPNHCNICHPGDSITTPDKVIPQLKRYVPFPLTCSVIVSFQYQMEKDSGLCFDAHNQRWRCGCNGGHYDYLSTNTVAKQAALVWIARISGVFSIMGSLYILFDILSQRKKKLDKTYPQLMLAIAIFDIINSTAWAFSTLPIPRYDEYGQPSNVYGSRGNDATCTAQGFFIQLGYTGIFYNLTLSLYYLFVIVNGWTETQLQKARKWLHGIPLLIGFSLAFAGIPFYANTLFACYIPPPPIAEEYTLTLVFGVIPICSVILFLTLTMALVYWKVHRNSQASHKWRMGGKMRSALEKEVLWQCVFYLCAFYISWPILIAAYMNAKETSYVFWAVTMFLAPIQGFNNCLVYVRPRLIRRFRKQRLQNRPTSQDTDGSGSRINEPVRRAIEWFRFRFGLVKRAVYKMFVRPEQFNESYVDPDIAIAEETPDGESCVVQDTAIVDEIPGSVEVEDGELVNTTEMPSVIVSDLRASRRRETKGALEDFD